MEGSVGNWHYSELFVQEIKRLLHIERSQILFLQLVFVAGILPDMMFLLLLPSHLVQNIAPTVPFYTLPFPFLAGINSVQVKSLDFLRQRLPALLNNVLLPSEFATLASGGSLPFLLDQGHIRPRLLGIQFKAMVGFSSFDNIIERLRNAINSFPFPPIALLFLLLVGLEPAIDLARDNLLFISSKLLQQNLFDGLLLVFPHLNVYLL